MTRFLPLLATVAAVALFGCAKPPIPYQTPVSVTPPSGRVVVSQAVNLLDASGSQTEAFASGKATLESIVAAMPNGDYQAGQIHFGGFDRETTPLARFDRARLATAAKEASFLQGTTPIFAVLERDVAAAIGGGSGRAAVVLISDGLATDFAGHGGAEERTLEAARQLASSRSGELCLHTVQTGDAAEGRALLQALADVTACGSHRSAASLGTAAALQQFSRDVYLGRAAAAPKPAPRQTPVAAVVKDSDGDGVVDPQDACPGTLRKARVDGRGCWTLQDLRFAVNGAAIESGFTRSLAEDIAVLKANPEVRIRVDGHTDSDGSAAYNRALSLRRAEAVRDYLVAQGLDADRFEVEGFGESKPIAPNDSAANKRRNRRVELTILD